MCLLKLPTYPIFLGVGTCCPGEDRPHAQYLLLIGTDCRKSADVQWIDATSGLTAETLILPTQRSRRQWLYGGEITPYDFRRLVHQAKLSLLGAPERWLQLFFFRLQAGCSSCSPPREPRRSPGASYAWLDSWFLPCPVASRFGCSAKARPTAPPAAAIAIMAPRAAQRAMIFTLVTASTGLSGIAAASIMALHSLPSPHDSALIAGLLTVISQCLTAMLAGSITVTWLLGHAYLTATKMTVAPLRHFSRMLLLSVGLRLFFLATSLLFAWFADPSGGAPPTLATLHPSIWNQLLGAWLLVTLRVGIGLFAVAVFAYMISDCVRLRATQSATGILYFGSVFVYVGELANQQLMIECGWPL